MAAQKHVVVSAINLNEGGPLTVMQDSLQAAVDSLPAEWQITALVHRKELFSHPRVTTLEFPQAKRSWLRRLWVEWFEFKRMSRKLQPDLWLSLHDITPRVHARRQVVYCHNASPFHRLTWREARLEPTFALFNLLYARLYAVFISRNQTVVVQQAWLRTAFEQRYAHPNVVVAHPTARLQGVAPVVDLVPCLRQPTSLEPLVLLYPALPRVFKNFEVLCEAMQQMPSAARGLLELRMTLSGEENAYARDLYKRFASVEGIHFIGRQSRLQMEQQYSNCDVVLFPSRLETWGLPITEAQNYSKPLLVADLPYAHETVGNCDAVTFLPAVNPQAWAEAFTQLVTGRHIFGKQTRAVPQSPFAANWAELWQLLTKDL